MPREEHSRRSRSPDRKPRARSRSPSHRGDGKHHRHRGRHADPESHKSSRSDGRLIKPLPFKARSLSKEDFSTYKALFAQYLDIQKELDLGELEHAEARGRWKSFVKKWNRGELAEGWYDPSQLQKASASATVLPQSRKRPEIPLAHQSVQVSASSSSEDEGPGPAREGSRKRVNDRAGPSIPSLQDLELQREQEAEDARDQRSDLRHERRADRKIEKEKLEELAPKAMAGTKERQMEKRREVASANRAFADAKGGGDLPEINETDLMGGDEGVAEYKKKLKEQERKKSEREVRRDEIARARQEEREERAREIQEKEARTMQGLMELAKSRFG